MPAAVTPTVETAGGLIRTSLLVVPPVVVIRPVGRLISWPPTVASNWTIAESAVCVET